jgi:hypothetical protein
MRTLAGMCVAVLLGVSGGAWGQATARNPDAGSKALPVPGQSSWSVFSCMKPDQGKLCTVPVGLTIATDGTCALRIADIVELDWQTTESIRWRLIEDEVRPGEPRRVRFGHTNTIGAVIAKGIKFEQDGETEFVDDDPSLPRPPKMFRKKLKDGLIKRDAKLYLYDVFVEWRNEDSGNWNHCLKHGPAIINRGR